MPSFEVYQETFEDGSLFDWSNEQLEFATECTMFLERKLLVKVKGYVNGTRGRRFVASRYYRDSSKTRSRSLQNPGLDCQYLYILKNHLCASKGFLALVTVGGHGFESVSVTPPATPVCFGLASHG